MGYYTKFELHAYGAESKSSISEDREEEIAQKIIHASLKAPVRIWCDFANNDGEMCAVELSKDLKKPVGEPKVLFKASEPLWAKGKFSIKENPKCVTDGPFMYRTSDGKLLMLWSSHRTTNCYCVAVSYSDNGTLSGNWKHCEEVLVDLNGGHGMLFNDLDGKLNYTYHFPNFPSGSERAIIKSVKEIEKSPFLKLV